MKKLTLTLCVLMTTALSAGVVPVEQFDPTQMDQTVYVKKGTSLRLNLSAQGNFVTLNCVDASPFILTAQQDFFVQIVQEEILFSTDCILWHPITELLTGTLGCTFDDQSLNVYFEANTRS